MSEQPQTTYCFFLKLLKIQGSNVKRMFLKVLEVSICIVVPRTLNNKYIFLANKYVVKAQAFYTFKK